MSATNGIGPDVSAAEIEQARQRHREEQRRDADEHAARSIVQRAAGDNPIAAPGYWDMLGDPDLDDPEWGDSLEAFLKGELSRAFSLGNITRKEYENFKLRIENEFWQVQNEMLDQDSGLEDDDLRLLYGEDRPYLNDKKARRMRSAREIKTFLMSLSVGNTALRAGTEIHGVVAHEDRREEPEQTSRFGRLGRYLGG